MSADMPRVKRRGFPLRLFATAFAISVVITGLGGWQSWQLFGHYSESRTRQLLLTECVGRIFKLVNDTFGHQAGDVVLKTLAGFIRKSLRNADYVARWAETSLDRAEEVLNRLRVGISNHVIGEIGRAAMLSFGVTAFAKSDGPNDLLARVDRALYMSKETGRNKVTALPPPAEVTTGLGQTPTDPAPALSSIEDAAR